MKIIQNSILLLLFSTLSVLSQENDFQTWYSVASTVDFNIVQVPNQLDKKTKENIRKNIDDAQLGKMIRDGINNQVSSKIDLIIEQEIEKIIKDKLQKTEIIIKSEDSNQ